MADEHGDIHAKSERFVSLIQRRETLDDRTTAILAQCDGGHALCQKVFKSRGNQRITMAVRVNKPWRDDPAGRVNDSRASWHHLTPAPNHSCNVTTLNPYLTFESGGASSINNQAAFYHRQRRGMTELIIARFRVQRMRRGQHQRSQ